ncbi:hypothetical protein QR680_000663 [Steinernema hermaphroditum]|uniref:Chitin-binding type-2 domain-containing protein n=1 Tax=Steinernema hermaphroditum TaxID=289476 RepID=A0AA39GVE1_9BILA|nr:hypothetical protein QR680_000663 [Steinernema hermaphroditum]
MLLPSSNASGVTAIARHITTIGTTSELSQSSMAIKPDLYTQIKSASVVDRLLRHQHRHISECGSILRISVLAGMNLKLLVLVACLRLSFAQNSPGLPNNSTSEPAKDSEVHQEENRSVKSTPLPDGKLHAAPLQNRYYIPSAITRQHRNSVEPKPFTCAGKPDGDHGDDGCHRNYFKCENQKAVKMHCSNGLYYDPEQRLCQMKEFITHCDGEQPETERPEKRSTRVLPKFDCLSKDDGDYSVGCSDLYFSCSSGIRYVRLCPENTGLKFCRETNRCDYDSNVPECGGRIPDLNPSNASSTSTITSAGEAVESSASQASAVSFGVAPRPAAASGSSSTAAELKPQAPIRSAERPIPVAASHQSSSVRSAPVRSQSGSQPLAQTSNLPSSARLPGPSAQRPSLAITAPSHGPQRPVLVGKGSADAKFLVRPIPTSTCIGKKESIYSDGPCNRVHYACIYNGLEVSKFDFKCKEDEAYDTKKYRFFVEFAKTSELEVEERIIFHEKQVADPWIRCFVPFLKKTP